MSIQYIFVNCEWNSLTSRDRIVAVGRVVGVCSRRCRIWICGRNRNGRDGAENWESGAGRRGRRSQISRGGRGAEWIIDGVSRRTVRLIRSGGASGRGRWGFGSGRSDGRRIPTLGKWWRQFVIMIRISLFHNLGKFNHLVQCGYRKSVKIVRLLVKEWVR